MSAGEAIIGVWHHLGWAVLVTVTRDGTLLDRRRIELVSGDLPSMPYHSEGQRLPIEVAVDLVERVRVSAGRHAVLGLDSVANALPGRIRGIAICECPRLPPTVAEQITNYRAQCSADSVMYRNALAGAAEARGWPVHWFVAKNVLAQAQRALGIDDIEALFSRIREAMGPPWRRDHKVAMAAAIVAANASGADTASRE